MPGCRVEVQIEKLQRLEVLGLSMEVLYGTSQKSNHTAKFTACSIALHSLHDFSSFFQGNAFRKPI